MISFNETRQRLELSPDELGVLVRLATGRQSEPPDGWADAGVVADATVHPVAAAMALVAVAPDRAVAIERLAGAAIVPLMVGWHRSGRATLTEHRPTEHGDGDLTIEATHFELLPALLSQAIGLEPGSADDARCPIETTAGLIDDAIVDLAEGGVFGSLEAPDELLALLRNGRLVVRATGSWQGAAADSSVTLVVAGVEGTWVVERDGTTADRDSPVRLVPVSPSTAMARLGDVVTGRGVPRRVAA
jgi:hypothetical protein